MVGRSLWRLPSDYTVLPNTEYSQRKTMICRKASQGKSILQKQLQHNKLLVQWYQDTLKYLQKSITHIIPIGIYRPGKTE